MFPARDGQVVSVSTPWRRWPAIAVVVEARFATCTVQYYGGDVLYTHDWCDVHLCLADALNRQRVLRPEST